MKLNLYILIQFVIINNIIISQDLGSYWEKSTGGNQSWSVKITQDNNIVIAGSKISTSGDPDMLLMKTDVEGNLVWEKTYGGPQEEMGYSLELTQDGGFIIVGFTDSYGAGNKDVFIVRTDSNGDSLWTRTFGDTTDDIGYSVAAISNGDFIIAGERITWDI